MENIKPNKKYVYDKEVIKMRNKKYYDKHKPDLAYTKILKKANDFVKWLPEGDTKENMIKLRDAFLLSNQKK